MTFVRSARIALAVSLAILLASAGGVASRAGPDSYRLTAYFPRAIGLFPRSTVRVLGIEVGRVGRVVPEGDRVRVDMRVRSDVRVPAGASAVIVPISLISDRYVQLTPVYRGGPSLRDGDAIPLQRTVVPQELDDLLATLRDFLQAIEPGTPEAPGALGQLVRNASRALGDSGPDLGTTVDSLATLLDVLGRNASHLDATIVSLDRVLATFAAHDRSLVAMNRGLLSVLGALDEERSHLEAGLGHLADAVDQVGGLVRDHRQDLLADIRTLAEVSEALVRRQEALERNLLWLPVLSQGVAQAYDPQVRAINVRDNPQGRLP